MTIVAGAAVIAVHHLSFNYMQGAGVGVFLYEHRTGLAVVLIPAVYVVFEAGVLVYMSLRGFKEALQSEEIHEIGAHLSIKGENIDLTYRKENSRSEFAIGFKRFMDAIHSLVAKVSSASASLAGR